MSFLLLSVLILLGSGDLNASNEEEEKKIIVDGYDLDFGQIHAERKKMKKYAMYGDDMFTFNLFENFEATREVFRGEVELVRKLKRLKEELQRRKETLLQLKSNKFVLQAAPVTKFDLAVTPVVDDFEGALRGLVFLHDTYEFELPKLLSPTRSLSAKKESAVAPLLLRNAHALTLDDFYRLTKLAFAFKWYDRAIEFLRVAFKAAKVEAVDGKVLKDMEKMKKNLVTLNNQNLFHNRKTVHKNMKVFPYEVGSSLKRKKVQPEYIGQLQNWDRTRHSIEAHFRRTCNGFTNKITKVPPKCKLLHHHNPYLKLGPFKAEIASDDPVIMIFHDFFTEAEMSWLVEYSKPRLTRGRFVDPYNEALALGLNKAKKVTRVIHKSVQCWIKELEYEKYYDNLHEYEENDNYTVHFPDMFKLTQKISLASSLNTTAKYATTDFQTTNYGLGGLCESHYDPHGYIEGAELPPHPGFQRLKKQGDMMATMMGWLEDVEAGGATAFSTPGDEVLVRPSRGSAAFWFNLDRKGHRDKRLMHGGCPIIKGSKWILNKWIYYFEQFDKFPCALNPSEFNKPFSGYYL